MFDIDNCRQYDNHNRILALVYLNGTNLNREMLRKGYADLLYIPPSEFVPHANFTYSSLNPVVNQSITFDASPSWTFDPSAAIIHPYKWDFGDGTNGTGKIVNHTYPSPGNYVVSLKVTDSNGDEVSVKNPTKVPEGENFTATVNIDDAKDLAIFMFKLRYEPSIT